MAHLIDKAAVVAEIERRLKNNGTRAELDRSAFEAGRAGEDKDILAFLDTLEVKEVDLEKEYKDFVEEDPVYNKLVNGVVGKAIAKHFFELGLKAKGE